MISLLFILLQMGYAQNPDLVFKNNKGAGLLQEEDKAIEAKEYLQKEVVQHPFSSEIHYNMGIAFEKSQNMENAIKEYSTAAEVAENEDLKFQAYFNAAKTYSDLKDIPMALKSYQKALEVRPDSKEVKTNIELLFAGGGGGGGSSENKKQNKDQDDKNKQNQAQNQPQPQQQQPQKKQPKPFKSEELSNQDVKRILDELKRQEEQIRAKLNNKQSKESPVEKDW